MAFEQLKARQAEVWGSAPFERVADNTSDMNDRLIALLGVRSGERWLDLTTGTGSAAIIAARRGAAVTGQDLAPRLIETARRLAAEQGTEIEFEFEVGDCEQLPYPDGRSTWCRRLSARSCWSPKHASAGARRWRGRRAAGSARSRKALRRAP